jgi:hypothetical protein
MIFHITYELSSERRNDSQKRFKETGGRPPAGVKMVGRWHCAHGLKGFMIAEASEAEALAKWTQDWTDVLSFEATAVITDEQLTRIIG